MVRPAMARPDMVGVIERRILLNYRLDPEFAAHVLPAGFRPQLVGEAAVGGVCLIRLGQLRPAGLPAAVGITTENAAHRLAAERTEPGRTSRCVYIPRRDTSSRLTVAFGGRLFPGFHYGARFRVTEEGGSFAVSFQGSDGTGAGVTARLATDLPAGSMFDSLQQASTFFRDAPVGYSPGRGDQQQAIELCCASWRVEPLEVLDAHSNFFEDTRIFPKGTASVDSAFLMRDLPARWRVPNGEDVADGALVAGR